MRSTSNLASLATRNSSSHSSEDYKCKVCNWTRPALNASLAASQLKVQYSRDKCWWKRSHFIQETRNLEGQWTDVLRPPPGFRLEDKSFEDGCEGRGCRGHEGLVHSSQTGQHQGEVLSIINILVSTNLGSTWLKSAVFNWWKSASCKNNLAMCVYTLSISFRKLGVQWLCHCDWFIVQIVTNFLAQ